MGLIVRLQWWVKPCTKLVLARLPIWYSKWGRVGLYRHGENIPARALQSFSAYYQRAGDRSTLALGFRWLEYQTGPTNWSYYLWMC